MHTQYRKDNASVLMPFTPFAVIERPGNRHDRKKSRQNRELGALHVAVIRIFRAEFRRGLDRYSRSFCEPFFAQPLNLQVATDIRPRSSLPCLTGCALASSSDIDSFLLFSLLFPVISFLFSLSLSPLSFSFFLTLNLPYGNHARVVALINF